MEHSQKKKTEISLYLKMLFENTVTIIIKKHKIEFQAKDAVKILETW